MGAGRRCDDQRESNPYLYSHVYHLIAILDENSTSAVIAESARPMPKIILGVLLSLLDALAQPASREL